MKFIAFIVCAPFVIPVAVKKNWWVDSQAPRAGTSAWQPHRRYSPAIEQALSILARVEPEEVGFVRERGFPIVFAPVPRGDLADTTGLGVIEIPPRYQTQPAQVAVLLAHEIFHEQRHDPFTKPPEYPLWRRVLWHTEEEAAHNRGTWVAMRLWPRYHAVWGLFGRQWLLEASFYWAVSPLCLLALVSFLLFAHDLGRESRKLFAGWTLRQRTA